jgi:hypothetical protein
MTKCIVIGEQTTEVKKKPIEFEKALNINSEFKDTNTTPNKFKNIELICKSYSTSQFGDIMFAYNDNRYEGILYLGKWNDGVAE